MSVLISCEVGGDIVPPQFSRFLADDKATACDWPARYAAQRMAVRLGAAWICNDTSIDLIDVARSLHHRQLFSPYTRTLPAELREQLIESIYRPYRQRVRQAIKGLLAQWSQVIHLSVRTYPPLHNGKHVRADMGLSYDPASPEEVDLCIDWIDELYDRVPQLRARRNYPRRGTVDSLTKAMRTEFADQEYLGIELMLNRAWAARKVTARDEAIDGICDTLIEITGPATAEAA